MSDVLSWDDHMNEISKKVFRTIGASNSYKYKLPASVKLPIFNSLIKSHILYCHLVWAITSNKTSHHFFSYREKQSLQFTVFAIIIRLVTCSLDITFWRLQSFLVTYLARNMYIFDRNFPDRHYSISIHIPICCLEMHSPHYKVIIPWWTIRYAILWYPMSWLYITRVL